MHAVQQAVGAEHGPHAADAGEQEQGHDRPQGLHHPHQHQRRRAHEHAADQHPARADAVDQQPHRRLQHPGRQVEHAHDQAKLDKGDVEIGLDQGEIYNRYRVVPEIHHKIQICNQRLDSVLRPNIDLNDRDELENFVLAYTFFAGVFEGTWFYNGFSPIFALQRRGLMKGTAEQFQYIMRDEVLHASFGIRVCNQIVLEEKVKLDPKVIQHMWEEAEAAESQYAHFLLPDPILGYSAADHIAQFRFIANRRANKLHHKIPFPGAENALPWLDEQANLKKEKNFFETRVTEYQTGGALNWD